MRTLLLATGALMVALATARAVPSSDESFLLTEYLRLNLADRVTAQGLTLGEGQAGVPPYLKEWKAGQKKAIRARLDERFGDESRARFESFVTEFTAAEGRNDPAYLARLAAATGVAPTPASYTELRQALLQRDLSGDLEKGSTLLARLQTWIEASARGDQVPPLEAWMQPAAPVAPAPPPSAAARLRNAEADTAWVDVGGEEEANPLDDFGARRQERRERAVEEARAGMDQVAQERQAAEEEYSQKKMAAAQADAEAIKRQADRFAAVEQQALEQRQKSWGNRLKSIVGATLSAATGAFTGTVGSHAGEQAAAALFGD